jgi:hypothetical protein
LPNKIFVGLTWFLLLVAIFSSSPTAHSSAEPAIVIVNMENASVMSWTAGPPRWVGMNSFIFYTNETETNDTFYIEIKACNVVDLEAWQINLSFNPTLLQCTGARLWFPGTVPDFPPKPLVDNDLGYVMYGYTSLGEPPFTGNRTLCWVGFQITKAPADQNETLTCELAFDYPGWTWLMNSQGEDMPVSPVNGHYEFRYPPTLIGDINIDGIVDMQDIGDVSAKFGATYASPCWDPRMDMNADLRVDLRDIGIVCLNFGRTL